jgi:hypothetical protein
MFRNTLSLGINMDYFPRFDLKVRWIKEVGLTPWFQNNYKQNKGFSIGLVTTFFSCNGQSQFNIKIPH